MLRLFGRRCDPALRALMVKLPAPGEVWSKKERNAWEFAFGAVLEVIYPDRELASAPVPLVAGSAQELGQELGKSSGRLLHYER